jgi:hypothetical protein
MRSSIGFGLGPVRASQRIGGRNSSRPGYLRRTAAEQRRADIRNAQLWAERKARKREWVAADDAWAARNPTQAMVTSAIIGIGALVFLVGALLWCMQAAGTHEPPMKKTGISADGTKYSTQSDLDEYYSPDRKKPDISGWGWSPSLSIGGGLVLAVGVLGRAAEKAMD